MVSKVEQQIFDCIANRQSFILDAGAGSGKTTTLVNTLKHLIMKDAKVLQQKNQKIICITYTNVAKNEIIERTEHSNLVLVNTIHDFLWDCIKNFQKELKKTLLELIKQKLSKVEEEKSTKTQTSKAYQELADKAEKYSQNVTLLQETKEIKIKYKNYTSYDKGVFSHDDLIIIAEKMFSSYPKLGKVIASMYPFIFIDEYQDTQEKTIKILLDNLKEYNCIIGFFGDKMQQIYDSGIGEIAHEYELVRIVKEENYRSSIEVVNLLNKIREDIQQIPIQELHGEILYYYQPDNNQFIKEYLKEKWNTQDIKVLYLTHRLIAKENGYEELYKLYKYSDTLTDNKNNRGLSPYTDFLFDIEEIVTLYLNKKIQLFLSKINLEIDSFNLKQKLKELMDSLIYFRENKSIEEVINYIIDTKIILKSKEMSTFDSELSDNIEKKEFHEKFMKLDYSQFLNLYKIQETKTPFSTQHGTKGDEFDNVLAIIDDKGWNKYNFNEYFSNINATSERVKRTKNLFYVICSRAKKHLTVAFISELSDSSKEQVKKWFTEISY